MLSDTDRVGESEDSELDDESEDDLVSLLRPPKFAAAKTLLDADPVPKEDSLGE